VRKKLFNHQIKKFSIGIVSGNDADSFVAISLKLGLFCLNQYGTFVYTFDDKFTE
jgi:hypothetical protein